MTTRSSYFRRHQARAGVADSRTPSIASVSVNFDRTPGGTSITLLGDNFLPNAVVLIGGVLANNIVVVNENTITFDVPPGVEGTANIEVVNFDGSTAVLPLGFEYIAGHITKILPSRGLSSGGQNVLIQGVNFVDGSTIAFGGVAATGVIFIDSKNFYVTTPSHADGAVDVVITEPSTAVVTARHGYNYTSVVFQGDIRRSPSVQIRSTLGQGVNVADFSIDGKGTQPIGGEKVIFNDGDYLIFAGTVQGNDVNIEGSKENIVWPVRAVDHSARFNRLRPFGVYRNVRATQVVKELVARFAPGFNTTFVQSNLPRISITLDGEQDFSTIMNLICKKIGNGNWYLDYRFGVHLFGKAVPPVFSAALTMPSGTAMTVTESTTPVSGYNLVPGYYYFATQGVYGHPKNWSTPGVPPNAPPGSEGYVQLSDEAGALNLLGGVSNGKFVETSPTHPTGNQPWWKPGWTAFRADGLHYASLEATPRPIKVAGDYYFASPDVAARLEALIPGHFKTALSPISNAILLDDTLPNFAAIPVYPDVSGVPCHTVNIFAVRYGDVNGPGGMSLHGYAVVANGVTNAVLPPTPTFGAPVQGPAVVPFAPAGTASASESELLNVDASFLALDAQAGYWAYSVTSVYKDGTESRGSIQSAPVLLDGLHQVKLVGVPIGVGINGVPVEFRKVYGNLFLPAPTLGTPDFTQGGSKLVAIITDNVSDTLTFPAGGSLNGGNRQPYNVPPGMEDTLGPDLESLEPPEDIDDNSTKLLADPPITLSRDESQLRNRVFVKGKGTVVVSDSQAGDRFVQVADTSTFLTPSGGGKIILGSRILEYKSLSTTVGQGVINLSAPLIEPILQSDWLFGGGLPVRPFLQVDDLESQQERGAIETDENGLPTDGVHEFTISDDELVTYDQMLQAGLSDLKKYSRPIDTLNYATRDQLSGIGKMVHLNLSKPPIFGDFLIQEVLIDQYHDDSDELTPRYNVTASPMRMSLGDLLLKSAGASSGGVPSMSGVVASAQSISSGSMPLPINKTFGWVQVSGQNYAEATQTPIFTDVNVAMTSSGGVNTLIEDNRGLWYRKAFNSVAAGTVIVLEAVYAKASLDLNPTWIWHFRLRNVNPLRVFLYVGPINEGTTNNTDTNSAGLSTFGIKYSSILGGGWVPFKAPNGTEYQLFPTLAPVSNDTIYIVKISVSEMVATIDVNGQSMRMPISDFPVLPSAVVTGAYSSMLNAYNGITAPVATNGFDFKSFYFERD